MCDRLRLKLIYARITLHCHANVHYGNELLIKHSTIIHYPLASVVSHLTAANCPLDIGIVRLCSW